MNADKTAYVTGATGLVGSHLIERLPEAGYRVKALVRPTSDTSLLESLGVELVRGDITDSPTALVPGMAGVTHLFHCAARVDDWGPRDEMVAINVDGLQNVLQAAHDAGVGRFVFLSSLVVYGGGDQVDLDESSPFVETGDNYNYTKIACERVLLEFARRTGLQTVVLRPPYVYGPRDRHFFPRLLTSLQNGDWVYLSGGTNPLTPAYVGNVVEACLLAATCDEAVGEAFSITDGESLTRKELVEMACEEMGYAPPTKSVPRGVAKALCPIYEGLARLFHSKEPPRVNRFRLKFAGATLTFDISKARRVLGYEPKYPMRETLREALRWFKENRAEFLPKE